MSRRLRSWLPAAAGGLVLVVAGAVAGLLYTEPGLQAVWALVGPRLPTAISVDSVQGRVAGPLRIDGFGYSTDAVRVRADSAWIEWRPLGLIRGPLRRRLEIPRLMVSSVTVELLDTASTDRDSPADSAGAALPTVSLPFLLAVTRADVGPVDVRSLRGDSTVLHLDALSLDDAMLRGTLSVDSLALDGPRGWLRTSLTLRLRDRYPYTVDVHALLRRAEGAEPVEVRGTASGDVDTVRVDLTLASPLRAHAVGTLADLLDTPLLDLRVDAEETAFADLLADAPEGRAGASVTVRGALETLRVEGTARATTPATGPVELDFDARRDGDRIAVDRAGARAGSARVDARGAVLLRSGSAPRVELEVEWSDLRWPLAGTLPTVRSASGSARVEGTTEEYRVVAAADVRFPPRSDGSAPAPGSSTPVAGAPNPPTGSSTPAFGPSALAEGGRFALRGTGSTRAMTLDSLRLDALGGATRARGEVAWSPEVRWDLVLDARDLTVGHLLADSAFADARGSLRGSSRGTLTRGSLSGSFRVDSLAGTLRGAPVALHAAGNLDLPLGADGPRLADGLLSLDTLDAAWQENRVSGSAAVADTVVAALQVALPDVGLLAPAVDGAARASLLLSGPRTDPRAEVDALAVGLRVGGGAAEAPYALDTVAVRIDGTPSGHLARVRLVLPRTTVTAEFQGGWLDSLWSGSLAALDVGDGDFGRWTLRAPAALEASASAVALDTLCLASEGPELCLGGRWAAGGPSSGTVDLVGVNGARLAPLLPEGWTVATDLEAHARASLEADGTLDARAEVRLADGTLRYPTASGDMVLDFAPSSVDAVVDGGGARMDFGTAMTRAGSEVLSIQGELALPEYGNLRDSLPAEPLEGTIRARVEDLSPLYALVPSLGPAAGDADADLRLTGTVGQPEVMGEARLRGGRADVPALGLELRDMEVTARGRGLQGLELEGRLRSDTGVLNLTGRIPVTPDDDDPVRVRVAGTRVQAAALPEARVWVSPDLELTTAPEWIRLTGEIRVPVARVEVTEAPTTAVRPSSDVVFVDDTTSTGVTRALSYRLRVTLGDSLIFRGFGLTGEPEGNLLITDGPGGTTVGTGDISIEEGRYRTFGQEFVVQRGRLVFGGGPVDDPGLDVRATRDTEDGVVAGVDVRGTLREPDVRLFTEPAMDERSALSYVVLGRGPDQSSEGDAAALSTAATALGLRQGNQIAGALGQSLGLDEMRIEANGSLQEAALVAGTYLSPKLYVSYGLGLFEPLSTFRVRYTLSRRWTVRAETGRDSSSGDFLFRIQRGR